MKEFDIYLRRRLTECDVLVYSIPLREGLTVFGRMVLESCLESYLLQKFVAAQTGSELEAHIDYMLATVYERLNAGVAVGASVGMMSRSHIQAGAGIELGQEPVKLLATAANRAYGALELAAEPILFHSTKKVGGAEASLEAVGTVEGTVKRGYEGFESAAVPEAAVLGSLKRSLERFDGGAEVRAELENLCYRFYRGGETAFELAASVKEIDLRYSAGRVEAGMAVSAEARDLVMKLSQARSALGVLTELALYATEYLGAVCAGAGITAEAGSTIRRFRKLFDMDPFSLGTFDGQTLAELDYIIIE